MIPVPEPEVLPVPEPQPEVLPVPEPQPEVIPVPEPEPEVIPVPEPEPEVIPVPEPETCVKEREAFKANKLPVEPSFEKDSCRYLAKQCNDEKCYCVSPKKGERKYGKLEVPLGQEFDCSSKSLYRFGILRSREGGGHRIVVLMHFI